MSNGSKTHIRWTVEQRDANRKLLRSFSFLALESEPISYVQARIWLWIAKNETGRKGRFTCTGKNLRTGQKLTLSPKR